MKRIYNLLLTGLLGLTILFMVSSCSHEDDMTLSVSVPDIEQGQSLITLEVRIPGLFMPWAGTYGMTSSMEDEVKELSLLAYRDAEGVKQLIINEQLATSDFIPTATGIKADLRIAPGNYDRIVLIANANTQAGTLALNSDYSALNNLTYTGASDTWPVTAPGYLIPMSVTLEGATINGLDIAGNRTFKNLTLTRMLAEIDIVNTSTATFDLKRVYLYNMNRNGTIIAGKDSYGATPKTERLPASLAKITTPPVYDFAGLAATNGTNKEMKGEIYVFEAAKADKSTVSTMKNSARIVLYGEYNGTGYYYPVDFTYSASSGSITRGDFMPVIRNYRYSFEVTKVSGTGFTSASAAMEHQGSFTNIQIRVHRLDDDFADVYYDGLNYLAVNTTGVEKYMGLSAYNSATADNTITVLTDAPTFTIECYNSDDTPATAVMMAPSAASYTGNGAQTDAYLVANYLSTATNEFDGYVIVKAGSLQSDRIPVYKWFCGKNGIPLTQTIGNNKYKTHRYPTGTAGAAVECWMVENSMEGTYSGKGYGLNASGNSIGTIYAGTRGTVNGYYYTWDNASTACPSGWSLPDDTQWTSLMDTVNTDLSATTAKWWAGPQGAANNAYAGKGGNSGTDWDGWSTTGHWWSTDPSYRMFSGNIGMYVSSSYVSLSWFSVRCIKN